MDEIKNENVGQKTTGQKEIWWRPAMFIFFRATAWIAAPVVLALYVGGWLEKKYGEDSHLVLISVAVAFVLTMIGLVKMTLSEFKKMDGKK